MSLRHAVELIRDRLLHEIDANRYHTTAEQVLRPHDPSGHLITEIRHHIEKKITLWRTATGTRRRLVADMRGGEYDAASEALLCGEG